MRVNLEVTEVFEPTFFEHANVIRIESRKCFIKK